jgi:hypothetical protein
LPAFAVSSLPPNAGTLQRITKPSMDGSLNADSSRDPERKLRDR